MTDWPREKTAVQRLIDDYAAATPGPLRVLEAGCGSSSRFTLPERSTMDGIDISEQQLARNTQVTERIQGDLQTYPLPAQRYDLVVCWDVLEHLPRPNEAVARMLTTTKPGGLVILAMPNVHSLHAKITKWTPLWFHTAYYRYVEGKRESGHNDVGPFKTYLRPETGVDDLTTFAQRHGFDVVYKSLYARGHVDTLRKKSRTLHAAYVSTAKLAQVASRGRVEPRDSSALIVLKGRPA